METITTLPSSSPSITISKRLRTSNVNHPFITRKKNNRTESITNFYYFEIRKTMLDMPPINATK